VQTEHRSGSEDVLISCGYEKDFTMKRLLLALFAFAFAMPAQAQDKLVVSIWGGSWRELVAETVARKFTKETGVPV